MESSIVSILQSMIEAGTIADTSLILVIIALLLLGYKFIFKPIYERIFAFPTFENVKEMANNFHKNEEINVDELKKKLDELIDLFETVEDLEKGSYREIKDLRRDVETIKQILNQFQGHMLYSGGRRTTDFGNRELK